MNVTSSGSDSQVLLKMMPKYFNKKKFNVSYAVVNNKNLQEIQNYSKRQCLSRDAWVEIKKVLGWMVSAETATFMKSGGLGVIASELPEAFNKKYLSCS